MKKTEGHSRASSSLTRAHNRQVQREIQQYLAAVNSYPLRVASGPYMTFERYFLGIMARNENQARRRSYRR